MPYRTINTRPVITERRAAGGWRASLVNAPGVYADGDTEDEALEALARLFVEDE